MKEIQELIKLLGTRGSAHRQRLTAVATGGAADLETLYLVSRYLESLQGAAQVAQDRIDGLLLERCTADDYAALEARLGA